MLYLFVWWFLLLAIGFAALPVSFRLLSSLPDRGYAFAKPLGILLIGYPFWLLSSLGLIQNSSGTIAVIALIVIMVAWGYSASQSKPESPWSWLREHWRHAVAIELVFSLAFFAFAYYRAFNPEIQATEKPMEFMFLNSILKSPQFPPHDSWLSGYAISYYYLGYVLVSILSKLASVPSSYSFNLGLIMVFAMSATGAFGLAYNLVKLARTKSELTREAGNLDSAPYVFGSLAVLLLLVVGNLEAPFESLHNAGIGSPALYKWLDVNGLAEAPQSGSLLPQDNWWWWRASRVVNDRDPITDGHVEVIDEFPSFSFLLGDLHPHVLALPFDLLALAVALDLLISETAPFYVFELVKDWIRRIRYGLGVEARTSPLRFPSELLFIALIVGALGMLNTWDIATYGFLIIAAFGLAVVRVRARRYVNPIAETVGFAVVLYAMSYALYLPFYLSFSSQVRGIAPTAFFKTPLHQFLMMFGLFIFVLASLVIMLIARRRAALLPLLREVSEWALPLIAVPFVIAMFGAVALASSTSLRDQIAAALHLTNSSQVILEALRIYAITFLSKPFVFILLTLLLASIVTLLRMQVDGSEGIGNAGFSTNNSLVFTLLLAFTGLLLTFGVEFLYIRDTFETRMNTVFKLYFQAWTIFAVAATFASFYIWRQSHGTTRLLWTAGFAILFASSLVFPILAYPNRSNGFQGNSGNGTPTLDGTMWIKASYPDDYAAIQWLAARAPTGSIVLEAPGPEYSFYDRVSMATGLQTVLGWPGHELQWRGTNVATGQRESDVEQIYKGTDVTQVRVLLQKYGVDYVVVGSLEREKYGLSHPMVDKFNKLGTSVFTQGGMQVFEIEQADHRSGVNGQVSFEIWPKQESAFVTPT